jgi:glycine betaine catabolism A
MERANVLRLIERLRGEPGAGCTTTEPAAPTFSVPAERYRDPAAFERERAALFGAPRVVAASRELEPGAWLPVDLPRTSLLLTRDAGGAVRGFRNACRHRGTRLVDAPCAAKAVACPYHAWTYDLAGRLIHLPHAETFPGVDPASRGLAPLPVVERHGVIWLGDDVDDHLGAVAPDLAALELDHHVLWRRGRARRRCNWKLVVEAFLDGYHIRVLHRDSVYRFFLDGVVAAEPVGPHIRALTARRALREAPAELAALTAPALRLLGTPSLLVFPSTTVVEHPDFVSIMVVEPVAPDLTDWDHLMLVPADRAHEAEHWDRSWQLIEEGVFQGEDLWVCEQAQRAIATGATDELLFGALEFPARWFHAAIAGAEARAAR